MDYDLGLTALKSLAQHSAWQEEFTLQEAQLRENLRDERRFGPDEQSRRTRARILLALNGLALEHAGVSFNDLCLGAPLPGRPPAAGKHIPGEPDVDLGRLRAMLVDHCSDSDIRDLCLDFRIDYDSLPGLGKRDKARELVAECARQGRAGALRDACQRRRPHLAW